MENKQLNSAESLELIQRMISQSRSNLEKGTGTAFLIWGYTSILISTLTLILIYLTLNPLYNWLFWAIPVIGWPTMYFVLEKQEKPVRTHIDRIIGIVWLVIGIVASLIPLTQFIRPGINVMIIPLEALILGIGAAISGLVYRFTPFTVSGFISIVISFALLTFDLAYWLYVSLFILMFIVSMIIPGHILNYRAKKCSKS